MTTATMKPCGCKLHGLTRNLAIWTCAGCGHVQKAQKSPKAACERCKRVKPANPRGEGCHGHDVKAGDACSKCQRIAEPLGRLPHPEVEYLSTVTTRGSFRARDSFLRCVGCLALDPESD